MNRVPMEVLTADPSMFVVVMGVVVVDVTSIPCRCMDDRCIVCM